MNLSHCQSKCYGLYSYDHIAPCIACDYPVRSMFKASFSLLPRLLLFLP